MTFSLFQVMLISGLINALILFFSLSRMAPRYRRPAFYLGLFILGYLLYHIDLSIIPDIQRNLSFIIPHLPILYFLPPLLFFFASSVFFPEEELPGTYRWLLIPGVLDILYAVFGWTYVQWYRSGDIYEFLTGPAGFFIHEGGALIFSAVVLGMLIRRLNNVEKVNTETFLFFKYILIGLGLILLRWLVFYIIDVFFPGINTDAVQSPFWILEAIFLIYIGYKVLHAPKVLNAGYSGYVKPEGKALETDTRQLRQLVEGEQLYLNPELSRKDLADKMECNEVHISALLREGLDTTFYAYLNRLRVKHAQKLIEEGRLETVTADALMRESGFKSRSTFYKAFRGELGITPSEYREQQG